MRVQDTATTCRERCGGQGYLSVNRFGAILGFAHAGMTAEGDNRVLMQKVKHSAGIPSQAPQAPLSDSPRLCCACVTCHAKPMLCMLARLTVPAPGQCRGYA